MLRNAGPNVIGDHRCDYLEAVFRQRCVDRIATAGANSEKPNALFLHIRKRRQEIDRATNVFDTGGRIFEVSRLAAALALVGRIEGQRQKASLRQSRRVDRVDLLLHAASRRSQNKCRI